MKSYETVFILNPALSEDQVGKSILKYEKFLKSNGAKLVHKENWGLKKLAYSIENKNSGFYNLFQFDAPSEIISPFLRSVKPGSTTINCSKYKTFSRFFMVISNKVAILLGKDFMNHM